VKLPEVDAIEACIADILSMSGPAKTVRTDCNKLDWTESVKVEVPRAEKHWYALRRREASRVRMDGPVLSITEDPETSSIACDKNTFENERAFPSRDEILRATSRVVSWLL
jgi:hypothetical protein